MPLLPGAQLGPFKIESAIGAGGMGEVWKARDTRLDRIVAIKVLLAAVADDPDRLARFGREAQVLASLNHPNIAQIYGLERQEGRDWQDPHATAFIVMELVDGEELGQRIARGPMPLDECLPTAMQIAQAIEAAHEQGIIHRDLKPSNIKVRADGVVKVLDFGLAKMLDAESGGSRGSGGSSGLGGANPTLSPTLTAATSFGVILGTAAYMAPEQAKGRAVDKRADIWAFGCVLFELLTGSRPFDGEDISDTLAFVLTKDPDWSRLPTTTPASIRQLLLRCLEKDPKRRLRDIGEARIAIESALSGRAASVTVAETRSKGYQAPLGWIAAGVSLIAAAVVSIVHFREMPPVSPEVMQFQFTLEGSESSISNAQAFAISPDGRYISYAVPRDDGRYILWVRALSTLQARRLAGTESQSNGGGFWSADSRTIAFFADGKLKKVDVSGGPPQTIAEAPGTRGGAWSAAGAILIGSNTGLFRVSATGGSVSPSTTIDPKREEYDHIRPDFLPDGRHFVYLRSSRDRQSEAIFVGSLDARPEDQPSQPLLPAQAGFGSGLRYVPPSSGSGSGFLLFLRDSMLMAQRFNPATLRLDGQTFPVADVPGAITSFSVSQSGILIYRNASSSQAQMIWLDRSGKRVGAVSDPATQFEVNLSPDGMRVVTQRSVGDNPDIWAFDVERGSSTRVTLNPMADRAPLWSPDGSQVVFSSTRNSRVDLFSKASSGAGEERLLLETFAYATDWSRDGRYLMYVTNTGSGAKTAPDLWVLPMQGDRKPFIYLATPSWELHGKFSPDGRWVAYTSDESGKREVYVRPFPDAATNKWVVSVGGGSQPRWRRDGKELFYLAPDYRLMSVEVLTAGANEATFKPGIPKALFTSPRLGGGDTNPWAEAWDVSPDGQRFLFQAVPETNRPPLTVVLNWQSGLKK